MRCDAAKEAAPGRGARGAFFFDHEKRGGWLAPVYAEKANPFQLRRGFAAPVSARLRRGWPKLRRSPAEGELTLQEG